MFEEKDHFHSIEWLDESLSVLYNDETDDSIEEIQVIEKLIDVYLDVKNKRKIHSVKPRIEP